MKKIMFLLVILILFGCKKKEENIVKERLQQGFVENGEVNVKMFINFSLSVQNRRKSREPMGERNLHAGHWSKGKKL